MLQRKGEFYHGEYSDRCEIYGGAGKSEMNKQMKGAMLALFGASCWGLSGSMGQYLFSREGMDSGWLVPIRLGLAGVLLFLYCLAKYGKETFAVWKSAKSAAIMVIYGLIGVSGGQFFYFYTIQNSSAAIATILQDLSPAMVLVVCCILDQRKPVLMELASLVMGIAGVFLLTTHGDVQNLAVPMVALVTGVLSAVCIMVYNLLAGRCRIKYPVVILQAWSFLMGGAVFAIFFRTWTYHYHPTPVGWFGVAFVVLVGNIVAFCAYISGVRIIGAEKGMLYSFAEPLTAAVIAVTFFHNPFTPWDIAGFVLIFLMILLISRSQG